MREPVLGSRLRRRFFKRLALTADAIDATKSAWADKISSFQKNYLRRIQKFDAADFCYNTLGSIFTMAKHSKKTKGPQRSENDAAKLKNGLSELTSQIQEKLNGNPYNKRKNPPTEASGKQKQRKQRDSEGAPPAKSTKAEEEALLAEIKALGGDEEDWRLINEVASDDEAVASESKVPVDKRLKEELAALSKELGFAGLAPVDASDDEEEEEGDQEEEEDEEDSDDDVSEDDGKNKNKNQNNSKTNKESKQNGPAENDMRRVEGLVSRYP